MIRTQTNSFNIMKNAVWLLLLLFVVAPAAEPGQAGNGNRTDRELSIDRAAQSLREKLIEHRRDLHRHPELSNREERTSRVIAEKLRALGLDEVKTGVGRYGVVALLRGAHPGPVVAVRTDMDALPILETLDVPYRSENPGVKHACGHDVHMSVELGVA